MKKLFAFLVPVALVVGCAHNDNMGGTEPGSAGVTSGSSQLSASDTRFVKEAAQGGIMEVKIGYMGVQNGQSSQVKNLGQKLIQDHTAANKELEQLAARKGVVIPQDLDAHHQQELDRLSKMTGAQFDQAFIKHAIDDHQKDIRKFQNAAEKANDQDLRAFAQRTLPVLQQHLDMAKSAQQAPTTTTTAPESTTPSSTTPSSNTPDPGASGTGNSGTGTSQ